MSELTYQPYNKTLLVIQGDRKLYSKLVNQIGGRWNGRLKNGVQGWTIPIAKEQEVKNLIKKISGEPEKSDSGESEQEEQPAEDLSEVYKRAIPKGSQTRFHRAVSFSESEESSVDSEAPEPSQDPVQIEMRKKVEEEKKHFEEEKRQFQQKQGVLARTSEHLSVKDSVKPAVKDSVKPVVKDSVKPVVKDSAKSVVKDSVKPPVKDSHKDSHRDRESHRNRDSHKDSHRDRDSHKDSHRDRESHKDSHRDRDSHKKVQSRAGLPALMRIPVYGTTKHLGTDRAISGNCMLPLRVMTTFPLRVMRIALPVTTTPDRIHQKEGNALGPRLCLEEKEVTRSWIRSEIWSGSCTRWNWSGRKGSILLKKCVRES